MLVFLLLCCVACVVQGQDYKEFKQAFPYANIEPFEDIIQSLSSNETVEELPPYVFACPTIPAPADTDNVNNLRPGNIRVVMSMGDSITAGMSAKDTNIISMKEYRGLSYSQGGDTGVATMPNFLRPYVPAGYPIGFSTGIGGISITGNGFNAAVSGAVNQNMLSQAQWLVGKLKADTRVDVARDWKVLTIWIGSNNLCAVCNDAVKNGPDEFERQLTSALEYLYTNVPRLFVNFMANLDITQVYDIKSGLCSVLHPTECPCVGSSDATKRAQVLAAIKEYHVRANKIAALFQSRNNPQFAVVVQPFLIGSKIPDRSYLSAADCFHPSAIAHQKMGIALWNSMLTPIAQKKTAWNINDEAMCPTTATLIYTK